MNGGDVHPVIHVVRRIAYPSEVVEMLFNRLHLRMRVASRPQPDKFLQDCLLPGIQTTGLFGSKTEKKGLRLDLGMLKHLRKGANNADPSRVRERDLIWHFRSHPAPVCSRD